MLSNFLSIINKKFTCSGYDLKTEKGYEEMMQQFEHVIGLQFLKALHVNDSKG